MFILQGAGRARLEVFNMLGQKVAVLVDENISAEYKDVEFNGADIVSGVCLCRLIVKSTGKEYRSLKKFTLMK